MSMKVPSPGQPGYISLVDAEAILLPHIPSLISVVQQTLALFLADPVVVRQASNLGRSVFLWDNFFPFAEITFAAVPGSHLRRSRRQAVLEGRCPTHPWFQQNWLRLRIMYLPTPWHQTGECVALPTAPSRYP